jgi:hypothetical protein
MALPAGVDKASGLAEALKELGLSADEVVAIGDAENDLAMLRLCGCGAAVATAVPPLKKQADVVTGGGSGRGVVELVEQLVAGKQFKPTRGKKTAGRGRRRRGSPR